MLQEHKKTGRPFLSKKMNILFTSAAMAATVALSGCEVYYPSVPSNAVYYRAPRVRAPVVLLPPLIIYRDDGYYPPRARWHHHRPWRHHRSGHHHDYHRR